MTFLRDPKASSILKVRRRTEDDQVVLGLIVGSGSSRESGNTTIHFAVCYVRSGYYVGGRGGMGRSWFFNV